jgi:alkylation response protein AidB-like acyl-CoA dehydrogenase
VTFPTSRQQELVARVAELGPVFRERAPTYDREAAFPYENFADLHRIGFLGLAVPERYGGLGADLATYALVSEEIGRHCGSTAITFNMHTATMLLTGPIADALDMGEDDRAVHDRRRAAIYRGVVENGDIHAQPFSEGVSPEATAGYSTRAEPCEGGYRITGKKIFASLSTAAARHNVLCTVPGDDRIRFMSVPAGAEGVEVVGEWDPLGMRGSISNDMLFHGVFVPDENELLPPGCFNQAAERFPYFYMTLSFSFLGLAQGALDFTRAYLMRDTGALRRRDHPIRQMGWAEMNLQVERARALVYRVLAEAAVDPGPDQMRRAWASVVTTMETAPAVAAQAIKVCGGLSLLKPQALERIYRDARCGAVMLPWSVEACLGRLGRSGLFDDEVSREAPLWHR